MDKPTDKLSASGHGPQAFQASSLDAISAIFQAVLFLILLGVHIHAPSSPGNFVGEGRRLGHRHPNHEKENTSCGQVMSTMYHEEEISEEDKTPFDRCQAGDIQWLQSELMTGSVSPELADSEGRTLLHWACDRGQTSTAVMLLQNGALPNCQDNEGLTPLHYACAAGDPVLVSRLLESGADPNVVDYDGLRPSQTTDCPTLRHLLQ